MKCFIGNLRFFVSDLIPLFYEGNLILFPVGCSKFLLGLSNFSGMLIFSTVGFFFWEEK